MGKYGDTAVRAAGLVQNGFWSPEQAWDSVAAEMFPDREQARRKSCPKHAFLGLCRAGLIRGVQGEVGAENDSSLNGGYARAAVHLLVADPALARVGAADLWWRVMKKIGADPEKTHNQQMDVVLALWNKRLVNL